MAEKRIRRWTPEDREWLDELPEQEQRLVMQLVAHLKAVPVQDDGTDDD